MFLITSLYFFCICIQMIASLHQLIFDGRYFDDMSLMIWYCLADLSQRSSSSCHSTKKCTRFRQFQEKADEAGLVIFVLSNAFAKSCFTREQVLLIIIQIATITPVRNSNYCCIFRYTYKNADHVPVHIVCIHNMCVPVRDHTKTDVHRNLNKP